MTKKVRIENADTSHYKVIVHVYDQTPGTGPDTLVEERILNNPADLAEFFIHGKRYIKIAELFE